MDTLSRLIACYQDRRFAEAETLCSEILRLQPDQPDALEIAGVLACHGGNRLAGLDLINRAIRLNPKAANYHNDLGLLLLGEGQTEAAAESFQNAIALKPGYVEAINNLGTCYRRLSRFDEALSTYRAAVALKGDFVDAYHNLGNVLFDLGRIDDAVDAYRTALELRPRFEPSLRQLINVLRRSGRRAEAIAELQHLLELTPDSVDAWNSLGMELADSGALDASIAAYRRAAALGPNTAIIYYNLGNVLKDSRLFDDAIVAYRQAIKLNPDFFQAHSNLGNVLKDVGELEEGIASTRRAIQLKPDHIAASTLLCTLHYPDSCDPIDLYDEHRKWNHQYAASLTHAQVPLEMDWAPNRRLRIGYVSGDFLGHPVGNCLLPVLTNRNRSDFEIFCYSNVRRDDAITDRLRAQADKWRSITTLSDEELAQSIRDDRIDILVDLSVHTGGNRLLAFARRPAPVQVTWLGWPGTTGLDAIDYRLSDPYLDPVAASADTNLRRYSEETIRLPHSFWCYGPLLDGPTVNELPATRNGHITFGCLNNFCKITGLTLDLWAKVMHRAAGSRLLVLAPGGHARTRLVNQMAERGISSDRIEFLDRCPQRQYLELYNRIDISLDAVPYVGHTTSMDSFWMGVPVVTLCGTIPVWRAGFSVASNLGMTELVAYQADQFVAIASNLAANLPRLAALRSSFRDRVESSPITDASQYAHDLETAFRAMWQRACDAHRELGVAK